MTTTENKPAQQKKRKSKSFWITFSVIATLLALVVFSTFQIVYSISGARAADIMAGHLERKYHEKFSVSNADYINSGLGVDGIWTASAHPIANTALVFRIDSDKNLSKSHDQYMAVLWEAKEAPQLQSQVKSLFNGIQQPTAVLNIVLSGGPSDTFIKDTSLEEVTREYPDFVLYKLSFDAIGIKDSAVADYNANIAAILKSYSNKGIKKLWIDKYSLETVSGKKYVCVNRSHDFTQELATFDLNSCLKQEGQK